MRKKLIKGASEFVGMALAITGFIVCMCDTTEMDMQLATMGIGLGMIVAGAVIGVLTNWGEKDEFPG